MSHNLKFYASSDYKTVVEVINNEGNANITCNGSPMTEMIANTFDGAAEKHVPVIEKNGNEIIVKVGSVFHPMSDEHSITWVLLETKKGCQKVYLSAAEEPVAHFVVADNDSPVAAYAYCNLHGFWKTEL